MRRGQSTIEFLVLLGVVIGYVEIKNMEKILKIERIVQLIVAAETMKCVTFMKKYVFIFAAMV